MMIKKNILKPAFIIIIVIMFCITVLQGCLKTADNKESATEAGSAGVDKESVGIYKGITVDEAYEMIKNGGYQILDVRTPEEYSEGHIAGSVLIPVSELGKRLDELEKELPVVVYCRSGKRSAKASEILKKAGFKEIYNVLGGITDWSAKGYPIEK